MESFCTFMVARTPVRYPFLRCLSINTADRQPSCESVNQLIEIFTHASRLEILHLGCDNPLRSEHRLQAACSSLTSLKEFSWMGDWEPIYWPNDPLYKMIRQMQSSLVKVCLTVSIDDNIGPDPAVLLHHSSATLEDLSVYYPTFQSELVQFPRMRKLSVYEADPPPALIALIFPNLMDLTVYGLDRVKDPRSPEDYQYRQQNLSVQLAGGGFTSLDRLAGGPLDLYRLGLTCQVRCVDIFRVDCDTHDMVAYILSNSRPSHVIIAFIAISPSCVRCFPDEVAVRLTYLQCTIDYMSFDGISDAFDTFYLLLQHSPLTHLKLYFTTGFSKRVPTNFLEESRPEAFASRIIASHPSIRYIAVGINDTERLFWKVTTAENGKIVVDKAPEEDISVVMEP